MPEEKSQLSPEHRAKLDGIVQQMTANKESDADIMTVVEDFKGKYGLKKKELANIPSQLPSGSGMSGLETGALEQPAPQMYQGQPLPPTMKLGPDGVPVITNTAEATPQLQQPKPLAAVSPLETTPVDQTKQLSGKDLRKKEVDWREKTTLTGGVADELQDSFGRGVVGLTSSILKTPSFLYDVGSAMQNLSITAYGQVVPALYDHRSPTSADIDQQYLKKLPADLYDAMSPTEALDKAVENNRAEFSQKYDKDISEYFAKGDYEKGFMKMSNMIAESAPTTIALMAGNAAGLTGTGSTALGTAVFGAQKKSEMDQDPATANLSNDEKVAVSLANGFAEGLFEQVGITKLGGVVKGLMKGKTKEAAAKLAKESFIKAYGKVAARFLGTTAEETLGEAATQFSQNAIDKYYGGHPELDLWKGVADAAIVGMGSAVAMGGPVTALDVAQTSAARKKAKDITDQRGTLETEMQAPDVTDPAKRAISNKIKDLNEEEAKIATDEKAKIDALPEDKKGEINGLIEKVKASEEALLDPNISDSSRELIQKDIEANGKAIDAIHEEAVKIKTEQEAVKKTEEAAATKKAEEAAVVKKAEDIAAIDEEMSEINAIKEAGIELDEQETSRLAELEQKKLDLEKTPEVQTKPEGMAGEVKIDGSVPVPENNVLKDVESTTEALVAIADRALAEGGDIQVLAPLFSQVEMKEGDNWPIKIAEAYHKTKADGSNPEFVKAVEEALSIKTEKTDAVKEIEQKMFDNKQMFFNEKQTYIEYRKADEALNSELEQARNKIEVIDKLNDASVAKEVTSNDDVDVPKYARNVSVLITPSTIRDNGKTGRIKQLSEQYNTVLTELNAKKNPTKKDLAKLRGIEGQILDSVKQEIVEKVSKIEGASVLFGDNNIGKWGSFEPSLNMHLRVADNTDTEALSNLLFDFAQDYSQDAFIIEMGSELENDYLNDKVNIPFNDVAKEGDNYTHYPQIIVKFKEKPTAKDIASITNLLSKNGVENFSLNDQELKVSYIPFLSKNELSLSKEEQRKIKQNGYDRITTDIGNSWNEAFGGNADLEIKIRKSRYNGARNEGTEDQTREYDRSDIFKEAKESLIQTQKLGKELGALRDKEIKLEEEKKSLSKEEKARLSELEGVVVPIMEETFASNRKKYEDAGKELASYVESVIDGVKGAFYAPINIKRPARAAIKTSRWYSANTEKLGDAVRTNIVTDSNKSSNEIFDKLVNDAPKEYTTIEDRRINSKTTLGFNKRLVEIPMANGTIAEVQITALNDLIAKESPLLIPEEYKTQAAEKLKEIRDKLGWDIPDGAGHIFYEVNRDFNVDQDIRNEAEKLSSDYYGLIDDPSNPKVTKEEFKSRLGALVDKIESADKTNWDKGNEGKFPQSVYSFLKEDPKESKPVVKKEASVKLNITEEEAAAKREATAKREAIEKETANKKEAAAKKETAEAEELIKKQNQDAKETEDKNKKADVLKNELIDEEELTAEAEDAAKSEDPATLDKMELDLAALKQAGKDKTKKEREELVDKKFIAMIERTWKAKEAGKIKKTTYTAFRNKVVEVVGAKFNLDKEELKFKVTQAFEKLKKKLLGEGYDKILLSSPGPVTPKTIADLLDTTNKLVNRSIDAGFTIAEALAKALKAIKAFPAYKRLLKDGGLVEKDFEKVINDAFVEKKPKEVVDKTQPEEISGEKKVKKTAKRLSESEEFKAVVDNMETDEQFYQSVKTKEASKFIDDTVAEFEKAGTLEMLAKETIDGKSPFHPKIQNLADFKIADRLRVLAQKEGNEMQKSILNKLAAKVMQKRNRNTNVAATQTALEAEVAKMLPLSEEGLRDYTAATMSQTQDTFLSDKQKGNVKEATKDINEILASEEGQKAIRNAVAAETERVYAATKGKEASEKLNKAMDDLKIDLTDC